MNQKYWNARNNIPSLPTCLVAGAIAWAEVSSYNGSAIARSGSRVDFRRFSINTETLRDFRYGVFCFRSASYMPKLVQGCLGERRLIIYLPMLAASATWRTLPASAVVNSFLPLALQRVESQFSQIRRRMQFFANGCYSLQRQKCVIKSLFGRQAGSLP